MTTFDERERAFEKKFALDQELKFRATARRDALIGEWAAARLGLSGAAASDYVKAVRKLEVTDKARDAVFEKVLRDLTDAGVAVTPTELREVMGRFMARVLAEISERSP